MKLPQRTAAARIALPYLAVATAYSLISHYILGIVHDDWEHFIVDVADDMLLISLTGFLLYILLRREEREWHRVDTLRQKANDELQKLVAQIRGERTLLQHLIENVPAAIAVFDGVNLRLKWGNPAAPALFGREPEGDITGQSAAELFTPLSSQLPDVFRQVAETGQSYENPEWQGGHPAGEPNYWRLRVMPLIQGDASCPDLMVLAADITEQVRGRMRIEQLAGESAEQAMTLTALLDVSRELTSTLELERLLQLILDQLGAVVQYGSATLFAIEQNDLVVLGSRSRSATPLTRPQRINLSDAPEVRQVLAQRGPVVIARPMGGGEQVETAVASFDTLPANTPCSWIGVPLTIKDNTIGVLELSDHDCGSFTVRDASVVLALASQAAVAIENARLYRHAQRAAALEERQRLSRELHDSVSQALYAIALNTQSATELAEESPEPLQRVLREILNLARTAFAEMRALIFELRTDLLERQGLRASLTSQAASVQARYGIPVDCDLEDEPDLALTTKEALYRIAQHALQNAALHGSPTKIALRLRQEAGDSVLEVQDDGVGFDRTASFPGHLGLQSMHERARGVGGIFDVNTELGRGTLVSVRIPAER